MSEPSASEPTEPTETGPSETEVGATRPLLTLVDPSPAAMLQHLAAALDGTGPALLPRAASAAVAAADEIPDTVPQEVALVVETSGSSGRPKRVMLSAAAVLASARATEERLGAGQWLLALPVHYIAGLQVLNRSLRAGTEPVILPEGPFTAEAFAAAARELAHPVKLTALVPVQLDRLLAAAEGDEELLELLRGFDAVLLGGQATPAALRERAAAAGVRLIRSYGASETAGGCLYDGEPCGDTVVRLRDGQLEISGSVLAEGYLGDAERTSAAFLEEEGRRWYRTQDTARIEGKVVTVTGRVDDVIVSGGVKVSLSAVETVVQTLPGLATVVVVAVPSAEWGTVPVAVADGRLRMARPSLEDVRIAVTEELGRPAAPAALLFSDFGLPRLESGKPDRVAITALAVAESGVRAPEAAEQFGAPTVTDAHPETDGA